MSKFFRQYCAEILIFLLFLFSRFLFLTRLPIFNDEAIYIDWGWRMTHWPKMAYYSLYDGKQPLLMWLFGFSQSIFVDPLWASRAISVVFGLITLIGLYIIGRGHTRRTALLAAGLYLCTPLFLFFDRQALMESALGAVGVWMFYFFVRFEERPHVKFTLFLALLLGIGFFIKGSAILFALALVVSVIASVRVKTRRFEYLFLSFLALMFSQIVLIPLYSQHDFWLTFSLNQRFSFGVIEVLHLPVQAWLQNIRAMFEISFWQLAPGMLFLSAWSWYLTWKKPQLKLQRQIVIWMTALLFFTLFLTRSISPRYLVSSLPLLTVLAAMSLTAVRNRMHQIVILGFIFVLPTLISSTLIISPQKYLGSLDRVSKYSQAETYLYSWTAGKAATEATAYLKSKIELSAALIGVRSDAGNPENTVYLTFHRTVNVKVLYFDQLESPKLAEYDCVQSSVPFYFVARDSHLSGSERFWNETERFYNEKNQSSVGIYELKECQPDQKVLQL